MGIFDPNNGFFRTLSRCVDVVGLSLIWFFLCLPVVTIGPATAALYRTVVAVMYEQSDEVFSRYFRSFRENLKVGIPAGILAVVLGIVLFFGFEIMYAHRGGGIEALTYAIYYIAMILPLGTACYLFPLLGRFTFTVRGLYVTALQLALAHLPTTLVVVAVTGASMIFMSRKLWAIFFVPYLMSVIVAVFLERVFRKHMPGDDRETTET